AADVARGLERQEVGGERDAPVAVGVGEPPGDLRLRGRNAAGTEQNALGLLLPEHGVLRADRLLERRDEVALLDREDLRKAQLGDDAHQGRVLQGYLRGRRSYERVHGGAHEGYSER